MAFLQPLMFMLHEIWIITGYVLLLKVPVNSNFSIENKTTFIHQMKNLSLANSNFCH